MSGRANKKGGGRGSRNKFKNHPERKTDITKSTLVLKFKTGDHNQAVVYEKILDILKIKVLQQYKPYPADVAEILETRQEKDFSQVKPKMAVNPVDKSKAPDAFDAFQMQAKEDYKTDNNIFKDRVNAYTTNKSRLCGLITSYCDPELLQKLKKRSDWVEMSLHDPLKLLDVIKSTCLSYQENEYPVAAFNKIWEETATLKQYHNESVGDYTRRFETQWDIFEKAVHHEIKYIVGDISNLKSEQVVVKYQNAHEKWKAYRYLVSSDRKRYGDDVDSMARQYSVGTHQYPATFAEAHEMLLKFEEFHGKDNEKKPESKKATYKNKDKHDAGQMSKNDETIELTFANLEKVCHCCGKRGHTTDKCYVKNHLPKEHWFRAKVYRAAKDKEQSHLNSHNVSDAASVAASVPSNESAEGDHWLMCQFPHEQVDHHANAELQFRNSTTNLREVILLDNQSTTNIFCNPNLVTNIRKSTVPTTIGTNGGVLVCSLKADVPGFGPVWFHPDAITNIFSWNEMQKRHPIEWNQKMNCFTVHGYKEAVFSCTSQGLYCYKPKLCTNNNLMQISMVDTVEENRLYSTPRQFERATKARRLLQSLGFPSVSDLKKILRMNAIKDNPVTTEDVDLAERIFGPDVGSLKGKTTRQTPVPVINDFVDIPPELYETHKAIQLCIDTMFVNKIPFLTTVSRNIQFRTADFIPNTTLESYRSGITKIIRMYKTAGFTVTSIDCDPEFKPLKPWLQDNFNISMNDANAQDHVPQIERTNRVIKERVRAAFHSLPYERLPKKIVQYLVMESTRKLNFFPPRGGVSSAFSPRMILSKKPLDYHKHCLIPFGTYVQAVEDTANTKNSQKPRTYDGIYLRSLDSLQGGHEVYDLHTRSVISRSRVTPIPVTPTVIALVNAIAKQDGQPTGLKMTTRTGHILFDSSWTAGVSYDEKFESDEPIDYDEESQDSDYEPDEDDEEIDDDESAEEEGEDVIDDRANIRRRYDDDSNDEQGVTNDQDSVATDRENTDTDTPTEIENDQANPRRSTRESRPPDRLNLYNQATEIEHLEYSLDKARVAALVISELNAMCIGSKMGKTSSFAQTYSLRAGLKKFGSRGKDAAVKEISQLHHRDAFTPIHLQSLSTNERKKMMRSLTFLTEKRDGTIKSRSVADGSVQRKWMDREEKTSPTAQIESIFLTAVIDAKEGRDVAIIDIPNAFIQADAPEKDKDGDRITMRIEGPLVDMLVDLEPERYKNYVTYRGMIPVLYVIVTKAIYGMLQAALLFYKKLVKDLQKIGFKINPYDPCVANRTVNGIQHTVTWHVDDVKSSVANSKVNDEFINWLDNIYGSDVTGHVKATRGNIHDYLGMSFDFSEKGKVKIGMPDYVKSMIKCFPEDIGNSTVDVPWSESLFKVNHKTKKLDDERKAIFHTITAKGLFLNRRARPDIQPAIAFFTTRIQQSSEDDWKKMRRMIKFLNGTKDDVLTLEADDTHIVKWHVDAAFAIHDDFRSHTGATMFLGAGAVMSASTKQKVNTKSSTEAELIGLDDYIAQIMWTKNFLDAQGYDVKDTIIYQDNMSTIRLAENGRASVGKRSRHLNIKYFFITDLIRNKQVSVQYCPTDEIQADYMSKPVTGRKFHHDRRILMNLPNTDTTLFTGVCRQKDRPSVTLQPGSCGSSNMLTTNLFATGTTKRPP